KVRAALSQRLFQRSPDDDPVLFSLAATGAPLWAGSCADVALAAADPARSSARLCRVLPEYPTARADAVDLFRPDLFAFLVPQLLHGRHRNTGAELCGL